MESCNQSCPLGVFQDVSQPSEVDEIQKLLEICERWMRLMIHPGSNVCVINGDDSDFRISGCPYRVISNIDDTKGFVCLQALKRQLSIYHKEHKCGSKVFMSTIVILSRCCLDCLQKGLSKQELTRTLHALSQFVQTTIRSMSIPCPRPQAQTSRHFSVYSRHGLQLNSLNDNVKNAVSDLTEKLCHRPWLRCCLNEVVSGFITQNLNTEEWKFHVHTAVIQNCNVHMRAYVREGFLIRINHELAASVRRLQGKFSKVLLVHGNLRYSYRHLGHQDKRKKVNVIAKADEMHDPSEQGMWRRSILESLISIGANVVLLSGTCCELLQADFDHEGILPLVDVPISLLESLSEQHDVDIFDYVLDATMNDLIENAVFVVEDDTIFNPGNMFCSLSVVGKNFQTVCFNHSTLPQAKIGEEEFWHEFSRIQSTLQSCRVLEGSGRVERNLAERIVIESDRLLTVLNTDDKEWAMHVVFSSFGEVLRRFVDEVTEKTDRQTDGNCDNEMSDFVWEAVDPRINAFQMTVTMITTLLNIGTCLILK